MSTHDRRQQRGNPSSSHSSSTTKHPTARITSTKSPIATPPRVALQGRAARAEDVSPESSPTTGPGTGAGTPDTDTPPAIASESCTENNHGHGTCTGHIMGHGITAAKRQDNEDKASRIATLEIEMAVMEEEFSRELAQLGQKITNESELSLYWQQKHSALNQQFLKADADLRVLRHEVGIRDKSREERERDRERDMKTRISSLILDRDTLREGYHAVKAETREKDEEIGRLRNQVKGLKDFVSVNSRMEGQVTDEVCGEMMRGLGNGLQNWVITNFRKAKIGEYTFVSFPVVQKEASILTSIDMSNMSEVARESISQLIPTYDNLASTGKVHLIQSLISRLLVIEIFTSYFVGLPPSRSAEFSNMEAYLTNLTGDPSAVNQWRSTTLAVLRKGSPEQLEASTEALITGLIIKINSLLSALTDIQPLLQRDTTLRALIINAIDLSRLLRVQKAVFKPIMPVIEGHQINIFDSEIMEDIGGEDEDGLEGREIRCVTFPGMIKEGSDGDEGTQYRNVIAKARVLCLPEE
jgi:activating signal cointegrator complex subunit 1